MQQFTSKLLPVSAKGAGGSQTPWLTNIDGGNYDLTNVNRIEIGPSPSTKAAIAVTPQSPTEYVSLLVAGYDATKNYAPISFYGRANGGILWNIGPDLQFSGSQDFHLADNTVGQTFVTVLSGSGRVGLAVASPAYQLDVYGDVNCTGAFRVNGVAIPALAVNEATNQLEIFIRRADGSQAVARLPLENL